MDQFKSYSDIHEISPRPVLIVAGKMHIQDVDLQEELEVRRKE